ncbi:hypothetical protein KFK09_026331 [Dendrobium nobile]|uniref:Uncharacterized protein n=1 Tax=Dendrobium nobile TaxID=94219 RepID=A0A8T3A698_DENNO|nr:hypothetical protein KFK09_026331 [Dendrobium nobile]
MDKPKDGCDFNSIATVDVEGVGKTDSATSEIQFIANIVAENKEEDGKAVIQGDDYPTVQHAEKGIMEERVKTEVVNSTQNAEKSNALAVPVRENCSTPVPGFNGSVSNLNSYPEFKIPDNGEGIKEGGDEDTRETVPTDPYLFVKIQGSNKPEFEFKNSDAQEEHLKDVSSINIGLLKDSSPFSDVCLNFKRSSFKKVAKEYKSPGSKHTLFKELQALGPVKDLPRRKTTDNKVKNDLKGRGVKEEKLKIMEYVLEGILMKKMSVIITMASGDNPPRKSFASKFRRKKFSVTPSRATQPDDGEGPSVPPDLPPPPPPRGQQQSPSEQGQGHSDAPADVPPYFPGHFPPPSMSPHLPSPDQTHAAPFYPYYPPPSSQAAGPSTGPLPPYPYPYYYPYSVQHEHCGPSRPPEVGIRDHAAATDKRQYIEPEGDK